MPPDLIHDAVRNALIRGGGTITADPYTIEFEEIRVFADLAAERLLALERGEEKIVVEIKSFVGRSPVHDLEVALGQYALYQGFLEVTAPRTQALPGNPRRCICRGIRAAGRAAHHPALPAGPDRRQHTRRGDRSMDQLTEQRGLIQRLLREYERLYNLQPTPGVETFVIFDEVRDHYLLTSLGWAHDRRVRRPVLYVRLRNGKFWIEDDWTETGIATALLRAGVNKEDIVLAFQPPERRPLTEFAVP